MQSLPASAELPPFGNRFTRAIGSGLLRLLGWRVSGDLPRLSKFIAVLAPHTSNWDFILTLVVMLALGIKVSFFAKSSIFIFPFGAIWRSFGGIAIDRASSRGMVEQMVSQFCVQEKLVLGIAPEGTRSKVSEWKSGFLHIAAAAKVPLFPVRMDYGKKCVLLGPLFQVSGDNQADMAQLKAYSLEVTARHPAHS